VILKLECSNCFKVVELVSPDPNVRQVLRCNVCGAPLEIDWAWLRKFKSEAEVD
jgi:rRNA maturation endonuclease Nob1